MPNQPRLDWSKFYSTFRDMLMDFEGAMDLYEFKVAFFIFKRTRVFGKDWEAIPLRHFLDGVYDEDGAQVAAATDISEPSLLRALRQLREKGLIDVREHPNGANRYRLKDASEVDIDHLEAYLRRHQPKIYHRMQARMNKVLRHRNVIRHPKTLGSGTPKLWGAVPQNFGVYNRENLNRDISKVPAQGAGATPRSIRIRKAD